MFTDRITLRLAAGKGGNGAVAWRREAYIPKGGPMGGDGGLGGSVVIETREGETSLERYRRRRLIRAENGRAGGVSRRRGRNGKDLLLEVPCGTLVKDAKTKEILHDLTEPGQSLTLLKGGKGGRGNASFKSATNRAPNQWTPGQAGEEIEVELELKLIADIGLIGFPNAGKSTFIESIASVRVKTAPYPFTTLKPNLGYVEFDDYKRLLFADIPGIIRGAHQNRGLGFEFLRHIERTRVLLFILDASGIDGRTPLEDYKVLRAELAAYDPLLLERPYLVALNKIDTQESEEHLEAFYRELPVSKGQVFEISAFTGAGLDNLLSAIRLTSFEGERDQVSQAS